MSQRQNPAVPSSHNGPRPAGPTAPEPGSLAPVGTLRPGAPSPAPPVPAAIPRPEYVGKATPDEGKASDVYDAAGVERIRAAGRLAAQAMEHTAAHIRPGVTTDELDRIAHAFLVERGAYPSCLGYRGFPRSICTLSLIHI